MPAYRAFVIAALVSLGFVAAIVAPWMTPFVLASDVALLAAIALDWRRASGTPLFARRLAPTVMAQGGEAPFQVRVENRSSRDVVLVAREALHPDLATGPLRERLEVPTGATVVWRYTLRPRRRGTPTLGPLTVRVRGPWGLAWAQRDLIAPEGRRVYPQTRFEGRTGRLLTLAHRRELGLSPLRRGGLGAEPYGVREYQPGDPLSRIHWKASARHGRLISREDAWERGRPLVVVLDCARAMVSLDDGRSKLDHALAAALALTRVAVGRGDRVTLLAVSDRIERLVRVRPTSRGVAEAYGALFDLTARLVEPAYDVAAESLLRLETRRASVVVFTSVVDLASAGLLHESLERLRRRHRLVLLNLQDPELLDLALGTPGTIEAAYAKAAALEVALENRRLGRQLRRGGIHALTSAADHLAWSGLEAYLRLSERARRAT
jgi:uncharacterized protein (DUF58 family)